MPITSYVALFKARVIRECNSVINPNSKARALSDEELAYEILTLLSDDQLDIKELCIIIRSLVKLKVDKATKEEIFAEWQIKASEIIGNFNSQAIANTLTAISKLKIDGNIDFDQAKLKTLLDKLIRRASTIIETKNIEPFNPQAIVNTLTAISKLKIDGNVNFEQAELKILLDKLIRQASATIKSFKSQEITNTLLALVNLELEQKEINELLSRLIGEASKNIKDFISQDIANFLWALSVLNQDLTDISHFKQNIIIRLEGFSAEDFTIEGKMQLFQALTYYNIPNILERLEISSELIKQGLGTPSSSVLHKLVEKNLKMIIENIPSCSIESEFFLPKISSHIDMKLQYKGKDYYIEVDGPFHFNARGEYTLIDLSRNKLFTQTCPGEIMIRLPCFLLETQTIQGPYVYNEEKIEISLRKILENIEKLDVETGVFIASLEELNKITENSAEKIADKKMLEPKISLGRGHSLRSQGLIPENKLRPDEVVWPISLLSENNNIHNKAEAEANDRPGVLSSPQIISSCGRGRGQHKRN